VTRIPELNDISLQLIINQNKGYEEIELRASTVPVSIKEHDIITN
jgi:hypothetical protein